MIVQQQPPGPTFQLDEPELATDAYLEPTWIPDWGKGPDADVRLKPGVKEPGAVSEQSQRESVTTFQSVSDMGHQKWIESLSKKGDSIYVLREPQMSQTEVNDEVDNVEHDTIWERLMDACVKPAMDPTGKQEFIPLGALLRVLSPGNVTKLLCQMLPQDVASNCLHEVYGWHGEPKRLKIMATLLLVERLDLLPAFIKANVVDSQLPLSVVRQGLRPILYDREEKEIESSHKWNWSYREADYFSMKQMHLCSLFCTIDEEGQLVDHFRLPADFPLPFRTPDKPEFRSGGFGQVTKICIEESHLWYRGRYRKPKYFAVKAIQHISKGHPSEADSLGRRVVIKKPADREHLHQLLFSFRRADFYYLVFEWADGDLTDLWKRMPGRYMPTIYEHICWFFRQCLGVVRSLESLHNQRSSYTATTFEELVHVILAGNHGRHSDIKPKNILWFGEYQGDKKDHLVIADLGLTQFNTTQSKSHALWADVKGYTQTYKAPESDTRGRIGTNYDIWSLGCVFLEHASVFLMRNYSCIKDFSDRRLQEEYDRSISGNYRSDTFYNVINSDESASADANVTSKTSQGEVKEAVKQMIEYLQSLQLCSDSMREFLNLIGKGMLVPDPSKRHDARRVLARLRKIRSQCDKDLEYACLSKQTPNERYLRNESDNQKHNVDARGANQSQILAGISGGQENPNTGLEISHVDTKVDTNVEGQTVAQFNNELGHEIYIDGSLIDDSSESVVSSPTNGPVTLDNEPFQEPNVPLGDIEELIKRLKSF
ncbi:serine/threonine protein kinase [Fusarium austroafricanum]|uniref:Serine/threonine protein kinase n=1 Tax=Fusarium austroafricanum TaxID=2364996 RepID=A0A8H4P459_9HYPO|nr:serine/threonine protein kinase [Fusarium austroafricanum]